MKQLINTAIFLCLSCMIHAQGIAYFAGATLTSDTDFTVSAQGLYLLRQNLDSSAVFFVDFNRGAQLSVNDSANGVGFSISDNRDEAQMFYSGETGHSLYSAKKGTKAISTILTSSVDEDTLAAIIIKRDSVQWAHIQGSDTVIQTLPDNYGINGQVLSTDGNGITSWQTISGTLSDTAIIIMPSDFTGDSISEPLIVNSTADTNFLLFADEGSGTLVREPDGYTFNSATGTISTPFIGRYRLLILR